MTLNGRTGDEWRGGPLLAFSALDGVTDYAHALTARTAFGAAGIDVTLPAACRVRFPQVADTRNRVAGDWFCLGQGPTVRGVFLDTHHLLIEGPCQVVDAEPAIAWVTDANRTLIGPSARLDSSRIAADIDAALRARNRWIETLRLPTGISSTTERTLRKALSIMKTQVYSPEGRIRHRWTTPDRWPHRRMWLWDSAFHAMGWRHIDPALARDSILAVLDMQAADGFIAHMMDPTSASHITQPPVLALGAKLVHDAAPDDRWIKEIVPKLGAYVEWDLTHRDRDGGGLVEWAIEGDPHCRSGESGMDNSPRFDTATLMDAVDFNSYLALECEILAGFAALLNLQAEAAKWRSRHARLCRLIAERLWSDEAGFYLDLDIERQAPSPVLASSGFLPLICGAASRAQAARLAECLVDPALFGAPCRVPSIAVRDSSHYAKDLWRGPVWVNVNWLIARGLDRYGYGDLPATTVDTVPPRRAPLRRRPPPGAGPVLARAGCLARLAGSAALARLGPHVGDPIWAGPPGDHPQRRERAGLVGRSRPGAHPPDGPAAARLAREPGGSLLGAVWGWAMVGWIVSGKGRRCAAGIGGCARSRLG